MALKVALCNFVLYANVLMATVAAFMAWLTAQVCGRALPPAFYTLIFSATLASYGLHWWLTPPQAAPTHRVRWTLRHKPLLLWLCLLGLLGVLVSVFYLPHIVPYLAPAALLAFLYTAPKIPLWPFVRLRGMAFAKTTYLSLVWTYVVALLPLYASGESLAPLHYGWLVNRFCFVHTVSILFDFRDRHEDAGIKNWVTYTKMN